MIYDSQLVASRLTSEDNILLQFDAVVCRDAIRLNNFPEEDNSHELEGLDELSSLEDSSFISNKRYDNSNRFGEVSNRENITKVLPDGRREIGIDREFTTAERILAGALGQIDTEKNVADILGMSVSQVARLKTGRTTSGGQIRPELVDGTRKKLDKIRDVAMEKLLATLGFIDNEDLAGLNAKDLSLVAGNLSKVVEKTMPKEDNTTNKTQIIMYAPQQSNIKNFQVVEV